MNENFYGQEKHYDLKNLPEHFKQNGWKADISEQNLELLFNELERILRYSRERVAKCVDGDCLTISKEELTVWKPKAADLELFIGFKDENLETYQGILMLVSVYECQFKEYFRQHREYVATRDLGVFIYASLATQIYLGNAGKILLETITEICEWAPCELIPAICKNVEYSYAVEWLLLHIYDCPSHLQRQMNKLVYDELLQRKSLTKQQLAVMRLCQKQDKKLQKLVYNLLQGISLFFLVAMAIPDLYVIAGILAISLFCFYTFEVWKF